VQANKQWLAALKRSTGKLDCGRLGQTSQKTTEQELMVSKAWDGRTSGTSHVPYWRENFVLHLLRLLCRLAELDCSFPKEEIWAPENLDVWNLIEFQQQIQS
jgi:hypothetical protein